MGLELIAAADEDRGSRASSWAGPALVIPSLRVHELFEQQVRSSGESVAVIAGGEPISYEALNARANRLARRLRELGVGADTLVGVCLGRSVHTVVAVLAVLKAGGGYVPVDPHYPVDRVRFMLEDTEAPVVLTQQEHRAMLSTCTKLPLVCLDEADPAIERQDGSDLKLPVSAHDLAYCLYTSGSTGKPKGVLVEHESVVNFLESFREITAITARDVLLSVTPLTFDICGLELYLPLLNGATVVVASREDARDPAQLMQLMHEHGATMLQSTPATWRLLRFHADAKPWRLRVALCGGEAMDESLADYLCGVALHAFNVYGPTETTIWSTCAPLGCHSGNGQRTQVSLGHPIGNTRIAILDEQLRVVAPGEVGEIHIGGAGLARGYLKRPDLSAERFIADPAASGDSRLYKTGDLGRLDALGELHYLGRIDHQVKLRGFRIELGEIESALMKHADVREAAVIVSEERAGDAVLVACLSVVAGCTKPAPATLRQHLAASLPEHMLPSRYVFLGALPLNSSGKVDRNALGAVALQCDAAPQAKPTRGTPLQMRVVRLWEEALGVPGLGVSDNFFDVGGTSLSLAALQRRLLAEFGTSPTLVELFDLPRVMDQAQYIEARTAEVPTSNGGLAGAIEALTDAVLDRLITSLALDEHRPARIVVLGPHSSRIAIHLALNAGANCVLLVDDDPAADGMRAAILEGVDEQVEFVRLEHALRSLDEATCLIVDGGLPIHREVADRARQRPSLRTIDLQALAGDASSMPPGAKAGVHRPEPPSITIPA
jgi:amino acid adenylation domain-containing protein